MYWTRFMWLLLSVGIPYFTIFVRRRLSNDAGGENGPRQQD
nr:MAG TPA: hypothetical protein [Caudoviricetes sp.]